MGRAPDKSIAARYRRKLPDWTQFTRARHIPIQATRFVRRSRAAIRYSPFVVFGAVDLRRRAVVCLLETAWYTATAIANIQRVSGISPRHRGELNQATADR
jgi:hypothetical protein